ncbi:MAG TPA: redoxin domain-containing protein [Ktedonobacterales bacterium]|jgi:peroxiredoxin
MAILGCSVILGVILSYLTMIFVLHRFTYRTWMFDVGVGAGMLLGAASWVLEGGSWLPWSTITLGILWFLVTRIELRIGGSKALHLRVGDTMPPMAFVTTDGTPITEQELIANAPTLLTLYRGWWCPSSKVQLQEIMGQYEHLNQKGVSLYAASVDDPETATPIQAYVGKQITILCCVSEDVLQHIGVLDKRGAPWYDRMIFGAPRQPIAMPATLVINQEGRVIFASRSTRVDEGPQMEDILASLALLPARSST